MTLTPALSDRLRAITERRLTADEVRARLNAPIRDDEREHVLALVRWFRRRYATPADRLAYVRQAHARWVGGRDLPRRSA